MAVGLTMQFDVLLPLSSEVVNRENRRGPSIGQSSNYIRLLMGLLSGTHHCIPES